jgi:long-chain acyl-CoA synthetase
MAGMSHVEIRPGDRIALLVPGSPEYVDLVLGLLAAGMFPVPLDPRLTESERAGILADIAPRLVVDTPDLAASMWEHTPDRFRRGLPLARPMHVTSGTTGRPKGVYSGLLDEHAARALVDEERELWGFAGDDVNLVISPLYHSAPLRFAMGTLLAGGRIVVPGARSLRSERSERLEGRSLRSERSERLEGFDPAAITAAIERERPTTMFCVPTHLQRLFRHWDRTGVPDLSSFRLVAHAGAACPPDVKRRLVELFPDGSTWEFYGSTEGQFTACRSEEWLERPGTVGRARPGRTLSVDDDGTIWCRVPEHARFSYWGDPEKTAAAWRDTADGPAFTVGDLGRLDEDGYLYLDGRREDLVISGGVNVYPVEVEHVLAEHPSVQEVAVFGVPDEAWGQRLCAAVVGDVDPDELRDLVAGRLSPPKRPKDYFVLDALPHTATGKLRRLELSERDWDVTRSR